MESLINLQDLDIKLPTKFSPIRRDISIVIDKDIQVGNIIAEVKSKAIDRIIDFYPFDIYQGDGIENNKKSIAFLILMQDTYKTLEDEEVNKIVDQVLEILQNKFKAKLR
jgi:phenylalanyl-tRNA synthetase beta chain